ncbi:hypothetical protein ACVBEF_04685 [Glaciimonas sp. GG7]
MPSLKLGFLSLFSSEVLPSPLPPPIPAELASPAPIFDPPGCEPPPPEALDALSNLAALAPFGSEGIAPPTYRFVLDEPGA